MKKITVFAIMMVVFSLGFQIIGTSQVLLDENFDYPAGDLLTAHGWFPHSGGGTQAITVSQGGLTFPGYIGSGIGNAALVDNNGEDDSRTFTVVSSGTVYMACMVKVTTAATGYFTHFSVSPINTTFRGKLFMNTTNHFGISVGNNTGTFAASTFSLGTTYLLVTKYEIVPGTNNDIVSLFIFDSAIPTTEPVATIGPLTDATMTDINPGSIALRQFVNTENITVDGIRVAGTWTDLFGIVQPIPTVSEWGLILLGVFLLGVGAFYIMRRRNSDVTA
jgi:hypothetical protein